MTTRLIIFTATVLFVAWTMLNTVFWPVEDYGDVIHTYTESTNAIARGMSLGITMYLSVLGITLGWHVTKPKPLSFQVDKKRQ
ncbi:MAG: hypothetical protein AAGC44_00995 [Planctomycetota bacterium]